MLSALCASLMRLPAGAAKANAAGALQLALQARVTQTPGAMKPSLGVTRNDNTQHLGRLEQVMREELKDSASRYFAVVDPVKVNITNHPGGEVICEAPVHPSFPERGMRRINLTSTMIGYQNTIITHFYRLYGIVSMHYTFNY